MNRPSGLGARIGKVVGRVLIVLAAFGSGFLLRAGCAPSAPPFENVKAGHEAAETRERKQEWWTCAMHPEVRLPKPGLCPKCLMKLIPLRVSPEQAMTGMREFITSDEAKALMDIETATVERKFVTADIRMVGKVEYDETRLAYITAWVPGRLDRLYVDYTGVPVRKGDHMVKIYSPELIATQEELLQAIKAADELTDNTVDLVKEATVATVEAAQEKLRLWGLTKAQIDAIEKRGTPTDHLTIYAPAGGIVIHKNAQEGMYVKTGTRIYTLADLSRVWVKLDAYESDLMWVRYGQKVALTTVADPGETFTGTISFIAPTLNPKTRTVKVRVNAPNPNGRLKPGMFVKAVVHAQVALGGKVVDARLAGKWMCPMHPSVVKDTLGKCDICEMPLVRTESLGYVGADPAKTDKPLVVPVSAVLKTGSRAIVYREVPEKDKPTYEGREIVLGSRAGEYYIVRSGLEEGDRVVTRGNFKIDSALQIQAKPSMMSTEGGAASGGHPHSGHGQKGSKPKPDSITEARMELSQLSQHQLHAVLRAADGVQKAVDAEDLSRAKAAFAALEKAVAVVDMKRFEGHLHMLWMEFSMRLTNDGVEGRQAKTLEQAARVAQSLAGNVASLRAEFRLLHEQSSGSSKPADEIVNARCPIMGTPLHPTKVPANLIRTYKGRKVGFCCAGCPAAWDKLTDKEKAAKLNASLPTERKDAGGHRHE